MSGQVTAGGSEGKQTLSNQISTWVWCCFNIKPARNIWSSLQLNELYEKYSRTHMGGASMGVHLPDSWQVTEVVTGPASRNPGLHWYVALAPREKSWPTMLPLTGGTGIPQDMTGRERGMQQEGTPGEMWAVRVKAQVAKYILITIFVRRVPRSQ